MFQGIILLAELSQDPNSRVYWTYVVGIVVGCLMVLISRGVNPIDPKDIRLSLMRSFLEIGLNITLCLTGFIVIDWIWSSGVPDWVWN